MVTKSVLARLSAREREIVRMVARGLSNAEIAGALCLNVQTVKNRLCEIYLKLQVKNRTELAVRLLRDGALE